MLDFQIKHHPASESFQFDNLHVWIFHHFTHRFCYASHSSHYLTHPVPPLSRDIHSGVLDFFYGESSFVRYFHGPFLCARLVAFGRVYYLLIRMDLERFQSFSKKFEIFNSPDFKEWDSTDELEKILEEEFPQYFKESSSEEEEEKD